jgi:hypothetical protein
VAHVRAQLMSTGLTYKQVTALILRSPLAVLLNPVHVSAKLDGLKVCRHAAAFRRLISSKSQQTRNCFGKM